MITLNTEKGLVNIESWDDVLSRPGFTRDIDPRSVKLKAIIGSYAFTDFVPCGLSSCHQPHGHGYLVSTQDGRETNIGRVCGKVYFSVDFVQMRKAFDRDYNAMRRREYLWAMKHRLPIVAKELAELKAGPIGLSCMHNQISQLLGKTGALPQPIVRAVHDAVRNNGALTLQRALTKTEREAQSAAMDVTGIQSRGFSQYVSEQIGQIEGHAALKAENNLRSILVDRLEPFFKALESAEIDSLSGRELTALYRAGADVDALLDQLRTTVADAARLLRRRNIEQLLPFAANNSDRRIFSSLRGRAAAAGGY